MCLANQKAFVICTRVTSLHSCYTFCTRVTEELHSFLSQSELSNFFVYIINDITNRRVCGKYCVGSGPEVVSFKKISVDPKYINASFSYKGGFKIEMDKNFPKNTGPFSNLRRLRFGSVFARSVDLADVSGSVDLRNELSQA